LLPAFTVFTDTDDDIETIVAGVQTLTVSLGAVTDESESVVLEVVLEFCEWPVASLINNLLCPSKVKGFDSSNTLGITR
jgi:hypothetical protein